VEEKIGQKPSPHELGKIGEQLAQQFLHKKKFVIIETGYRLYRGEIDIIAHDGQTLVFVEVKTRWSHKSGFPEEAVTPHKQRQLRKIAESYCALNDVQDKECRFDVISLLFDRSGRHSLSHIKNAF
jgi:putative endonuclease